MSDLQDPEIWGGMIHAGAAAGKNGRSATIRSWVETMNKHNLLEKISLEIAKCKLCKSGKSGLPVPGEGNPNAK